MPLTETVVLNIQSAQRQIDELEADLKRLSQPINVPVDVEGTRAADELRQDFSQADTAVASLNNELEETGRELQTIDRRANDASDGILRVGTRGVSAFTSLKGSIIGVGAAFAAIAGARAFLGFAGEAIQSASNLQESLSKTGVVFGDFADDIEAFAQTGPQALGLANQEALEFTATFGNLFVALGLSQEAAAQLSPEIVQLGADLASFNNIDVAEALEKLRSGLVGEAEPLRVLGVNINEALVQAKALELGLVGVNGELSEAAKVQARYALIVEQTATAQGDFARTADGIANRQRTLTATFEDLRAEVGGALLPVMENLLTIGEDLAAALPQLIPVIQGFATAVASVEVGNLEQAVQVIATIPDAVSVFSELPGAVQNFAGALAAIGRADFITAFNEIEAGIQDVQDAADKFDIGRLRNQLINNLQAGVEPAVALRTALRDLAVLDVEPEKFEELALALVTISGVDSKGISELRNALRPGALGLSADEVRELNIQLALLAAQDVFSPERFRELPRAIEETVNQIGEVEAAFGALPQIVEGGLDAALRRVEFAGSTEAFAQQFTDTLTDNISTALKDEEGNVEDNAKDFVDRFITSMQEEAEFQQNLDKLRELGHGLTAAVVEGMGAEEGAPLAASFLSNPEQIARFEEEGLAAGVAAGIEAVSGFTATIEAADFGAIPIDPIVVPLVFGSVGPLPTFPQLTGQIPSGGGQGGFGPQTVINNNFNTTPAPTTDTQRISQSTAQITGTLGAKGPQ